MSGESRSDVPVRGRGTPWSSEDTVELPRDAHAARVGRNVLRDRCGNAVTHEKLREAELLLSEVVTNAWRHGRGRIELAVQCSRLRLTAWVRNGGTARPRLRDPGPDDESGRGLVLLDALSEEWGVYGDDSATVVWFSVHSDAERADVAPSGE